MKQTILLLFLFMVGLMPAKADNITVDGTSRSYNVIVPNNLGEGRRNVIPEVRYRYKLFGNFVHQFSNGLQLTGEVGLISDRDFM